MMGERTSGFAGRMRAGERLVGTFLKTPAIEVIEVLAMSGLDCLCLDAEHAPFGRRELDACLAMGRALDLPLLVRVGAGTPDAILQALDSGAVGVVVPHVDGVEKARAVARWARFGVGGRGYAGSTRWAGFATRAMPDVLAQGAETVVIAQIEEPEGVDAAREIAAVPGIDALFVGPADLAVGYGVPVASPEVDAAYEATGRACAAAGIAMWTWVAGEGAAAARAAQGVTGFLTGSEHAWMLAGARAAAEAVRGA